jgi:hypothetical protein
VRPDLHLKTKFPGLASFTARCEDLDAFKAAPIPDPPS